MVKKISILLVLLSILSATYAQNSTKQKKNNSTSKKTTEVTTAKGLSPKATALLGDLVLLNHPLSMDDFDMMKKYGMELIEGYVCVPVVATLKENVSIDTLFTMGLPVKSIVDKSVLIDVPVMEYVNVARLGFAEKITLSCELSETQRKRLMTLSDTTELSNKQKEEIRYENMVERVKNYYNPEQGFFQKAYTDAGDPHFMIEDKKGNFTFGIGGNVHFTMFYDYLGSVDGLDFTTTNISVPTDYAPHFGLTSGSTKLNFRATGNVGKRKLFAFIEMGVGTSSNNITIRHAYASYAGFTIGHTWSLFMDLSAGARTVDLEGPNTQISRRHPLIAYTLPLGDKWHMAFSAEAPSLAYVFGGTDLSVEEEYQAAPDIVVHAKYKGDIGHVQMGAIFRTLAYYYNDSEKGGRSVYRFGWGVSASGSVLIAKKCIFAGQAVLGQGIATYIQDFNSDNVKLDLLVMRDENTHGILDLAAAPVCGFYVSLQALWTSRLNSSFIYGYTNLLPIKGVRYAEDRNGFLLGSTHYAAANLFFDINPDFSIGAEFLFGLKKGTLSGEKAQGFANRFNCMLNYRF